MAFEIRAYTNCDDATVVWRPDTFVPECRGFALYREAKQADGSGVAATPVETWMGFDNEQWKDGEHHPSTKWPVQRYLWTDYEARHYAQVRYQVVPMVGKAGALTPSSANASAWTPWCSVGTGQTPGFAAYFNRGIVPAQWMARTFAQQATPKTELTNLLKRVTGGKVAPVRAFLGGQLRTRMLDLLQEVKTKGQRVYAALYELNDPELLAQIKAIGADFNLILASGAYKGADKKKGTPAEPDENADIRADLKAHTAVKVTDRLVKSPHFAHNKYLVICDANDTPLRVWTGSTNWTVTGLCTQVNNGILIESPELAACFKKHWEDMQAAGDDYPDTLLTLDTVPTHQHMQSAVGRTDVTVWQAPVHEFVDLADARRLVQGARQGVLFLMFNPGKQNTLLNDILALNADRLFIHGVVNQDPGGKTPILTLYDRGTAVHSDPEVVLPADIDKEMQPFSPEFRYNNVMIHSKVIVVDPFGTHPVVITGSHNLGPKASSKNDDNMVIIENAHALAAEYAVNILGVYGHYKFRFNQSLRRKGKQPSAQGKGQTAKWKGLHDDDAWQRDYMKGDKLREIDFWFGRLSTSIPNMTPHGPAAPTVKAKGAAGNGANGRKRGGKVVEPGKKSPTSRRRVRAHSKAS